MRPRCCACWACFSAHSGHAAFALCLFALSQKGKMHSCIVNLHSCSRCTRAGMSCATRARPPGLLTGMESRAKRPEYARLLAECIQMYCDTRLQLVAPVVTQRIAESARGGALPTLTRNGCAYLMQAWNRAAGTDGRGCWVLSGVDASLADRAKFLKLETEVGGCGQSRCHGRTSGSCYWLPNRDPMSYSECQIGPSVSYWFYSGSQSGSCPRCDEKPRGRQPAPRNPKP
jgi:hypothetical protein